MKTTLQQLAIDLQAKGFVILCDNQEKRNYFIYTDGKNIAYVEKSKFFGFNFSKSYVPSRGNGSGLSVFREVVEEGEELLKAAIDTINWEIKTNGIELYSNVEIYIQYQRKVRTDFGPVTDIEKFIG